MTHQFNNHNIILASGSPRRQKFLKDLEIDFQIQLKPVEEIYPDHLKAEQITDFLSELKAEAFKDNLKEKDILITSDTIVWHNEKALGKPKTEEEAVRMIKSYINSWHKVISSVSFTTNNQQITKSFITKVHFGNLTDSEITHYVSTYKPMDKAGAYGIQEWIGLIGIDNIEGSYFNVVGLPTHIVYKTLNELTN